MTGKTGMKPFLKIQSEAASPQKIEKLERLGKDEMNLVEHPFALLRRTSETVFHLEWEKTHPRTNKPVKASWRVTGDSELGLPGPVEERLYLVLMELSREQGWPQKVMFSRHDILQRLGMSKTQSAYETLHHAFLRLNAVMIDAKRSFWKADAQDFAASLQFHILDETELIDEAPGRRKGQIPLALSSFTWGRILHQSFVTGNIRSLHIDFALSLELPLAARLFRYLDKHRTGNTDMVRNQYEIELHRLCEIHLGMTKAKYASKLKERLLPALTELQNRGFLAEWSFEPMKTAQGSEKVVFTFANGALQLEIAAETPTAPNETVNPLKPMFAMLSQIEYDDDDGAHLDATCDRVFAALDAEVQAKINARARESLPPFLQQTMSAPGALRGMEKERRAMVWSEHKAAVRDALKSEVSQSEKTD